MDTLNQHTLIGVAHGLNEFLIDNHGPDLLNIFRIAERCTSWVMCARCAVMMSVTRHVQHHFYAFHGTAACSATERIMLLALLYCVGCGTGRCL